MGSHCGIFRKERDVRFQFWRDYFVIDHIGSLNKGGDGKKSDAFERD